MNKEQNKKVEDILGSLDSVQKAVAPDFFYTRLKARMEKGFEPTGSKSWVLRPVYAMAALVVVILVNAAVIYNGQSAAKENTVADIDISQSVAAEYSLNDNSVNLYDLNMDK
jgi:hypothetical protein